MEKDMNKTAENRRNAAESVLNVGIEYSAFENMDRLAAIFAMQKLVNCGAGRVGFLRLVMGTKACACDDKRAERGS